MGGWPAVRTQRQRDRKEIRRRSDEIESSQYSLSLGWQQPTRYRGNYQDETSTREIARERDRTRERQEHWKPTRDESIGNLPERTWDRESPWPYAEGAWRVRGVSKPLFFLCKWRPACGTSDLWNLLKIIGTEGREATIDHEDRQFQPIKRWLDNSRELPQDEYKKPRHEDW